MDKPKLNKSSTFRLKQIPFPSANVSLVIIQRDTKFVCTDEPEGWFLPAGMVDSGESFKSAALYDVSQKRYLFYRRESMEEAGLEINLTGILRLEYNYGQKEGLRFRCLFMADPLNPEQPLKMTADKETYGAAYLSLDDIEGIGRVNVEVGKKIKLLPHRQIQAKAGSDINLKSEKLRSGDVIKIFEWVASGTKIYNINLLKCIDGDHLDNSKNKYAQVYSVGLILYDNNKKMYFLRRGESTFSMPIKCMETLQEFHQLADVLLEEVGECVNLHSEFKVLKKKSIIRRLSMNMKNTVNVEKLKLKGICGVYHQASNADLKASVAKLHISYYSTFSFGAASFPQSDEDPMMSGQSLFSWMTYEQISKSENVDVETKRVIKNHVEKVIAPLEFLVLEGSRYEILS